MGLTRDEALVTSIDEVELLAGVRTLENLESEAGYQISDALLEAHRWVFDRLKRRFSSSELATITNQVELKRAVAFRLIEVLAAAGHVGGGEGERAADTGSREFWAAQAREEVDAFVPEFLTSDQPRRSDEGIPAVGHLSSGFMFSDDVFYEGTPEAMP